MKTIKKLKLGGLLFAIVIAFALSTNAYASNIRITSEPTIGEAGTEHGGAAFKIVRFSLAWDYSWRSAQLRNWDGAWVFVKYRVGMDHWDHMYIDPTFDPRTGMQNNGVAMAFEYGMTPDTDGGELGAVGIFLFREGTGQGNINWQNIGLRWRFDRPNTYIGREQLVAGDEIIVRVFAIEMVYIPEGSFFLGDGSNMPGTFTRADELRHVNIPFQVTSEGAISLAIRPADASGLSDVVGALSAIGDSASVFSTDSFGIGAPGTNAIPGAFPKGYRAFWVMKYEITQSAYMDFLNTLTHVQQVNRMRAGGAAGPNSRVMVPEGVTNCRNNIRVRTAGVIEFGMSTANDVWNQEGDGHGIANAMGPGDLLAYLAWAGLRPMTELEFEKIARGPLAPVPLEFVWGATVHFGAAEPGNGHLINPGQPNEAFVLPAGVNHNNSAPAGQGATMVTRNGAFATSESDRIKAGATFWGVMEMGSNLAETVVNISTTAGRGFRGTHGDGRLTREGAAEVLSWPEERTLGAYIPGIGHRGGNVSHGLGRGLQTLSQRDAVNNRWEHQYWTGGRGVRTAGQRGQHTSSGGGS